MLYNEYTKIGDKQLAYIRQNEWNNDVILFFHGFTGSKGYFPELDNTESCIISFDRPGVGESSVVEYYSMEDFLKNVYAVLKSNEVTTVRLIGHSAGGYYAQVFAQMFPEIVGSLTLVSSMIPINCPKTKKTINSFWKFISFLSLKAKGFSRSYFRKMSKSIQKGYDKQLAENMKTISDIERKFMEENPELIKSSTLNAVANDGAGVCYDAYALCQKREKVDISENIPIYIWQGTADDMVPVSFLDYYKAEYKIKEIHMIENVGHMLYLPYWFDIIKEVCQ